MDDQRLKIDFIIKRPFDSSELTRRINNVLDATWTAAVIQKKFYTIIRFYLEGVNELYILLVAKDELRYLFNSFFREKLLCIQLTKSYLWLI
jgi:hypothetical protein